MPDIVTTDTSPASPEPPEPKRPKPSKDPSHITLAELLVNLGLKLNQHLVPSKWLKMKDVAALCRNYRLEWQKTTTAKVLGDELLLFFGDYEDFVEGEVTITPRISYSSTGKTTIELWFSSSPGEVVAQEFEFKLAEWNGVGNGGQQQSH